MRNHGLIRDGVLVLGMVGISASVWLKDWQLAPGIVGALLVAVAIAGYLKGNSRIPPI